MASFIFFDDYAEALRELSDKSRLKVFDALCDYVFKKTEPDLKGESKAVFALIKREIDLYNKRVENGKKGGRKTSEVKPYLNHTSTTLTENKNHTSTILSENKNQTSTILNLERESPYKELPREKEKEKERSKEKEKEKYNPQENTPQEKETDPLTPLGGWSDGRTKVDKAQKEFFALYPKIRIDNYSPSEYSGIDFELLIQRFEESEFLRGAHSFSFICKNYPKIVAGEYKDFYRRVNFQENKLGSEWDDLK